MPGLFSLPKNLCLDESARVLAGELEGAAASLKWDQMPRKPCRARIPASEGQTFAPNSGAKATAFSGLCQRQDLSGDPLPLQRAPPEIHIGVVEPLQLVVHSLGLGQRVHRLFHQGGGHFQGEA